MGSGFVAYVVHVKVKRVKEKVDAYVNDHELDVDELEMKSTESANKLFYSSDR